MKHSLQLRQSQQLALTPQLQQAIRLLQLSTTELLEETTRLLDENPFLECEDETASPFRAGRNDEEATPSQDPSTPTDEPVQDASEWLEPGYTAQPNSDDETDNPGEIAASRPSMREQLLWSLGISPLGDRDKKIISLLIDALDENAYLSQPLEEIAELIPAELNISLDDLETALVQLQHLDIPGIGARNLSECLALQLRAMPEDTPGRALALRIVVDHLDLLAARDYTRLKKILRCDEAALRAAHDLIVQLHPKPGAAFEQRAADYVVPDVIVKRHGGIWQARLNPEAMPRLRINRTYADILQQRGAKPSQEISTRLQEARWFIRNLQQRSRTILRVAQAIVERQRQFFEHGDVAMRPLVMREIAEEVELHESTISRVTTQKYMLTPRGIYEFKYFFSSGLTTEAGGVCSSTAIRSLIRQLVSAEDARHPLTDSRLTEILAQQGIRVARRTVAKYREEMNIPPVNLRKSL